MALQESVVLLPTFNERENLSRLVPWLSGLGGLDVLVIDDASPDGTGEFAEQLSGEYPRLSVLHRREKEGLGRAYVHGIKEALARGYSRVVTMDADLSHSPEDVPRLLEALEDSAVAVGSRHAPGGGVEEWPIWRRILSRAGSRYARVLLGITALDVTSGFRAYRAQALEAIALDSIRARGFAFQVEVLRRILDLEGARVREVPILFRNRRCGRSKLTAGIIAEAAREVLRLRFREIQRPRSRPRHSRRETRPLSVSVIIPLHPGAPEPRALAALDESSRHALDVILARGECPSRQRNLAAREASGDLLLFLDDDSDPGPELIERYLEAFAREPDAAAIGGPAVYRAGSLSERLATALLAEPLVTGRSAARYGPRGRARKSDERELILANLAVRRSAFERAGGFDEAFYPNEENLLIEGLRDHGESIWYEPSAVVTRPAPRAGIELFVKVFGYGRGRAAQARESFTRSSAARLSAVLVAALSFLAAALALPWTLFPLISLSVFLVSYSLVLAVRISLHAGFKAGLLAPVVASGVHVAYAAGILWGLIRGRRALGSEVRLERRILGGCGRLPPYLPSPRKETPTC